MRKNFSKFLMNTCDPGTAKLFTARRTSRK